MVHAKKKSRGLKFTLLPFVLITALVFVPMFSALITSFKSGLPMDLAFSGLSNYKRLFRDAMFINAFKNTILYLVIQVPVMLFLGLIFASLLNDKKMKFIGLYRTALFLPCVTSLVSYSLIMKNLFGETGVINNFLVGTGLADQAIPWFTDPFWARVLIIISITWRWMGLNMIYYISGMQNIEQSVYEAAEVDGAGKIQQFFKITIPNLKPIILFTSITSTIGTLQLFDEVQNITQGGPANATMTISQYIYNVSYKHAPDFGYATAVAFVIMIMIITLSLIQRKVMEED